MKHIHIFNSPTKNTLKNCFEITLVNIDFRFYFYV